MAEVSVLSRIAKDHNIWKGVVINIGCPYDQSEDIVQEMYIKIDRLEKKGNDFSYGDNSYNKSYVYKTLYSMFIDSTRKRRIKTCMLHDNVDVINEDYNYDADDAHHRFHSSIISEMNTWHNYYSQLCKIYFSMDYSMRDLASELDCGLTHIYNVVRIHREKLVEKFSEDFEDYKNQDYDKL